MNACDHPHGGGRGKSKGNKHPRSVFGWLTKGKRTRRPRDKDGNKMCVLAGIRLRSELIFCFAGLSPNDQEDAPARTRRLWPFRLVHCIHIAYTCYKTDASANYTSNVHVNVLDSPQTPRTRQRSAYPYAAHKGRSTLPSACRVHVRAHRKTNLVRRHFPVLDRRMRLVIAQLEIHTAHYPRVSLSAGS